MKALAIIGDIVDSKKLTARARFQAQLARTLRIVANNAVGLASPYTVTLGDEFQAVYLKADSIFADLFAILAETYPVRVRFAIGIGEITTRINRKQAIGMDGPAFHHARASLLELKSTHNLLAIAGEPETTWAFINSTLSIISHQIEAWKKNRLHVMMGLLRDHGIIQISSDLKISTVATYKNIHAGALHQTSTALYQITRELNAAVGAK